MKDVVALCIKYKKNILLILGAINLLATIILFLVMKPIYRAETTLLPSNQDNSIGSQVSGLASLVGINVGGSNPTDPALYPEILQSRRILEPILMRKYYTNQFKDSVNLLTYLDIGVDSSENDWYEKSIQKAIRIFQNGILEINVDNKTSIVTITINIPSDPKLAATVANLIAESLGYYNREVRNTEAREQLSFLERRLSEVSKDLQNSEDTLAQFREKNRIVEKSPQLQLDLNRLTRTVEINQLVYGELKKNFEMVKLEVIKNTPVINILDYAFPPVKKDKPKRLTLLVITNILSIGFILSFLYVRGKKSQHITIIQDWLDSYHLSFLKKYL